MSDGMTRTRIALVIAALLLVVVAGFLLRPAWLGGMFRGIEPHFDGRCRLVEGPGGAEDVGAEPNAQFHPAMVTLSDSVLMLAAADEQGTGFETWRLKVAP